MMLHDKPYLPASSSPCDPEQFAFASTAELEDVELVVGQARALDAIQFGIHIRGEGYNIARTEEIEEEFKERQVAPLNGLREEAKEQHIILIERPAGFAFAPLDQNNEVLSPAQFGQLPEAEQQRISALRRPRWHLCSPTSRPVPGLWIVVPRAPRLSSPRLSRRTPTAAPTSSQLLLNHKREPRAQFQEEGRDRFALATG